MPADALAAETHGDGVPLVVVHGFTQTAASWRPIIERLGAGFRVTAVDAPGHGASRDVTADLPRSGDLIADVGGRATYVGYSMGARMCLHVALQHPDVVERLVLVSGTAGIDDAGARAGRRADDEARAEAIERDGVDVFIERWLAMPMFASLPREAAGIEDRRANTAAGLAGSLRLAGTGTQQPLWDRLPGLSMPTLIVVGALDHAFTTHAERMVASLPHAELAVIDDAGHTVHLEQPDRFTALLRDWLARTA